MADYTVYFNGEWMPDSQVTYDRRDRGIVYGDCVFDGGRAFNGVPFRLRDHIQRLFRSLKHARIDPGLTPEEMEALTEEAVRRNEHLLADAGDFVYGYTVTRGPGRRAYFAGPPTVLVTVGPEGFSFFAQYYENGVHAAIAQSRSYDPVSLDPKLKHRSRMNFSLAEIEANDIDPGAWPILLDTDGNISEGTINNVFVVTDGAVRSPTDRAILQGVSRDVVLELAKQLNIPAYEEDLQPYDLYTADEAFFTGSSYCVMPVTRVDRRPIGDGKPGPITEQLLAAWSETVGVDIVDQAVTFADKQQ